MANFKDIILEEITKSSSQIFEKIRDDEEFAKNIIGSIDFASIALHGYNNAKDNGYIKLILEKINSLIDENKAEIKEKLTSDKESWLKDKTTKLVAKITKYDDKVIEGIKEHLTIKMIDELVENNLGNEKLRDEFNQKIIKSILDKISSK